MNYLSKKIFILGAIILFQNNVSGQTIKLINEAEYNNTYTGFLNQENNLNQPIVMNTSLGLVKHSYDILKGNFNFNVKLSNQVSFIQDQFPVRNYTSNKISLLPIELYYNLNLKNWRFAIGRKLVRFGVGYVASPTDIIAQRLPYDNPTDRLYQIAGNELLQISYTGNSWSYDAYLLPETYQNTLGYFKKSSIAMRLYKNIKSVDANLVTRISTDGHYQLGLNATYTIGQKIELHGDIMYQDKSEVLYPDTTNHVFVTDSKSALRALVGINWSPKAKWNVVLEYFYLSEGYNTSQWSSFNSIVNSAISLENSSSAFLQEQGRYQINTLGANAQFPMLKNYIFFRVTKSSVIKKIDAEWISFIGLDKISSLQRFAVTYKINSFSQMYSHYQFIIKSNDSDFYIINYTDKFRLGIVFNFSIKKKDKSIHENTI